MGIRISTCGSVNARKPRSCNNRLPAGKGYGVVSAMGLSTFQLGKDKAQYLATCFLILPV